MNIPKLRAAMVEHGVTVETLADDIGINKATLYRKLAANGIGITIGEAESISRALGLSAEESARIFFA